MHVVVVTEKDGKIELTKDELHKMLDESYNNGYSRGYSEGGSARTITSPNWPYRDWTITYANAMRDFTQEENEQYRKDMMKQYVPTEMNVYDLLKGASGICIDTWEDNNL